MDFKPMKEFMDRLTDWKIPGNSISVCLNNKEVFSYQSGYENIENKVKMTADKMFNIYSCTKVSTAVAAMQLYEKGYFLLDDPIYEFLPEFKDMYVKGKDGSVEKAKTPITFRHILTMTSGITGNSYYEETGCYDKARKLAGGNITNRALMKCLAEEPLLFQPGEKWSYAMGLDIIAAVAEVITGKKYRDYTRENIFEPLGMKDTLHHNDDVLDRVATQYNYEDPEESDAANLQATGGSDLGKLVDAGKKDVYDLGPEYDSGSTGIVTTVADYSKFVSALANWGVGANGERILSKSSIELMRINQLTEEQRKGMVWPQLKGYGYGLGVRTMIDRAKGGSCGNLGEFGWGGAAGATVLVDPDINLSMFYTHHMLNPQETYYQPRLRNVLYTCINR